MSFKQFEKRKKSLLVEYKNQFKANSFTDKRIGENDQNLSLEDKMFKRFVAERKKGKDKKNKFNLNDDNENENGFGSGGGANELTHGGQSLAQIENFERVELSDDEKVDPDDPEKGKISAEFVAENFFGGFKANDAESKQMNRKEWIDEMILKSKQLKYERQKERDKTLDLTEELDKEWKQIQPLINVMVNKNKIVQDAKEEEDFRNPKKPDDYDVYVKTLMFDDKAKPSDKLKTDLEIEKEESDLKAKNEQEFQDRMNGEVEMGNDENEPKKTVNILKKGLRKLPENHRSVDDMDFDDPDYTQIKIRDEIKNKHKLLREENEKNELEERVRVKELEENPTEFEKNGFESENEEEKEDGVDMEEMEDEEEESDDKSEKSENDDMKSEFHDEKWIPKFESFCIKLNKNLIDLKEFEKSIRALMTYLDPSKDENNKARLCLLTEHLIDYYQSLFHMKSADSLINMKVVDQCTNFIYELISKYGTKSTKDNPSLFISLFKKILGDLNSGYMNLSWNEKKFPQLSTLFIFKLISTLFPTSDFRHQITTPCLLIMSRYLMECSVQTSAECFRGLFLSNLCHEFVSKSKRFIPECVQYLNGMLYLAIDWKKNKKLSQYDISTIFEAFKTTKLNFIINEKTTKLNSLSLSQMSHIDLENINDTTKASMIAYAIDLLQAFANSYELNTCFPEIFSNTDLLLSLLPVDNYPNELKTRIKSLVGYIEDKCDKMREHLICLDKKPVASKMLEPKIQTKSKFDPRHHNSVISEKQLLKKKYKKEHKGAIKEVRLDSQFLARVQLKEQLEKDSKRAAKVKEIMGSLASQEGEYQKMKRMKS